MKFLYLFLIFAITLLVFVKYIFSLPRDGYDGLDNLVLFLAIWVGIFLVFWLVKGSCKK